MPLDSDPLLVKSHSNDDLITIATDVFGGIQYKLFLLMFIAFLVVSSDMFVGRALARINGAVDMKTPTSYGTLLQGIAMIFAVLIMDALIRVGVV